MWKVLQLGWLRPWGGWKPTSLTFVFSVQMSVSVVLVRRKTDVRRENTDVREVDFLPPLALPSNSKTWLERVSKDKPSSLEGVVVGDDAKTFYTPDTWPAFDEATFFTIPFLFTTRPPACWPSGRQFCTVWQSHSEKSLSVYLDGEQ